MTTPARTAACLLAGLLGLAGCRPAPEAPAQPPPAREPVEVLAPGGERTLLLVPTASGYLLQDRAGWSVGGALIDDEGVVVTDRGGAPLVRVTRTEGGFSLSGAGQPLMGTDTAAGLVLTRGDQELARWRGEALLVGRTVLQVARNGAYAQVQRDGEVVVELRGPGLEGAAYLALKELPFPERVGLFLIGAEP